MSTCTWSHPLFFVCVCWNMVESEFWKASVVRGHHVYRFIWSLRKTKLPKRFWCWKTTETLVTDWWSVLLINYIPIYSYDEPGRGGWARPHPGWSTLHRMWQGDGTARTFTRVNRSCMTPTKDTVSAEEMAPREEREGVMRVRGGSCQGPSLSFSRPVAKAVPCVNSAPGIYFTYSWIDPGVWMGPGGYLNQMFERSNTVRWLVEKKIIIWDYHIILSRT